MNLSTPSHPDIPRLCIYENGIDRQSFNSISLFKLDSYQGKSNKFTISNQHLTMKRILEPEVMDTREEAAEYDAMDFVEVNQAFAQKALEIGPQKGLILDAGTGTARIPIFICQERLEWQIIAIDLSQNMLIIGDKNIKDAGLEARIKLELVDAKNLPYLDCNFDAAISNSILHHLPEPLPFWQELKRVLKPGGGILIKIGRASCRERV